MLEDYVHSYHGMIMSDYPTRHCVATSPCRYHTACILLPCSYDAIELRLSHKSTRGGISSRLATNAARVGQ